MDAEEVGCYKNIDTAVPESFRPVFLWCLYVLIDICAEIVVLNFVTVIRGRCYMLLASALFMLNIYLLEARQRTQISGSRKLCGNTSR